MSLRILEFIVAPADEGTRLDVFLTREKAAVSRNQVTRWIAHGQVQIQNVRSVKNSYKVRAGDRIQVSIPPIVASENKPQDIPLEILFEDRDLVVVNKPAGLVCHPAAGHHAGTLVNALLHHVKTLSSIGGVQRPGLVHRLDKETSGILVVAKNDRVHLDLSEQFRGRKTHRLYWALVAGLPKNKEKTLQSELGRHPSDRKRFASVDHGGKLAITGYAVQKSFAQNVSLLHVKLQTGRTHQIRVHLSEMGHPILGDALYGKKTLSQLPKALGSAEVLKRHALHAAELGFTHPGTGEKMLFKVDWPEDLKPLLQRLSPLGN